MHVPALFHKGRILTETFYSAKRQQQHRGRYSGRGSSRQTLQNDDDYPMHARRSGTTIKIRFNFKTDRRRDAHAIVYLLRHVLKVTTHQDHIKTSPKFAKMIPRLNLRRRSHSPHPFGPQRSAWCFTVEVSDSSASQSRVPDPGRARYVNSAPLR